MGWILAGSNGASDPRRDICEYWGLGGDQATKASQMILDAGWTPEDMDDLRVIMSLKLFVGNIELFQRMLGWLRFGLNLGLYFSQIREEFSVLKAMNQEEGEEHLAQKKASLDTRQASREAEADEELARLQSAYNSLSAEKQELAVEAIEWSQANWTPPEEWESFQSLAAGVDPKVLDDALSYVERALVQEQY